VTAAIRYELEPRAVRARALFVAAASAAMAVAPAWLVVALIAQLGLAKPLVLCLAGGVIAVLGVLRGALSYVRLKERLTVLAIEADAAGLTVRTPKQERRLTRASIVRAVDIDGRYGGLRLELANAGDPSVFDVPRGGASFSDLRACVGSWVPIERPRRRSRVARFALGAAVILALFFVPFLVADARGSRMAVALVLVVAWGAMRVLTLRLRS
jgi:hypothetical protein